MKKSLIMLLGGISFMSSMAFAADYTAPTCPSISDIQNTNFEGTYQKPNGSFAAVGLDVFGGDIPWAIVQMGLHSDDTWEANRRVSKIDTQLNKTASPEVELGFPVWGCVYTASSDPELKVVAVTAMDTLGLVGNSARSMNLSALAQQAK
jgi:hypothetical protein